MHDIIQELHSKDNVKAYNLLREIDTKSAETNEYYEYFEGFLTLLKNKGAYVRTRGFILICAQARWDIDNKIGKNFNLLLPLFHDEKPIVVRLILKSLHELILYKSELSNEILTEINKINVTKYKDTMAPLINKDIQELKKMME